jgi:hypothetical protein
MLVREKSEGQGVVESGERVRGRRGFKRSRVGEGLGKRSKVGDWVTRSRRVEEQGSGSIESNRPQNYKGCPAGDGRRVGIVVGPCCSGKP